MNSCKKGANGERELAGILADHGFVTERGGTCSFGTKPDLMGLPGVHIEVKRVERLNVNKAMQQAINDSAKFQDGDPTVFHRQNRSEWLVTMRFEDWIKLYKGEKPVSGCEGRCKCRQKKMQDNKSEKGGLYEISR